jgi:hypothetical protein
MARTRTISGDDVKAADEGGFALYTDGDYSTGEGVGKKLIAWQVPDFDKFASGSNAWLYFQFYKALGVVFPKAGESEDVDLPELIDIIDQEIGFHLTIQEASGNYKAKNQVSRFFPASDGIEAVDAPPSKDDEAFTL